jgi:hypothetical protein
MIDVSRRYNWTKGKRLFELYTIRKSCSVRSVKQLLREGKQIGVTLYIW